MGRSGPFGCRVANVDRCIKLHQACGHPGPRLRDGHGSNAGQKGNWAQRLCRSDAEPGQNNVTQVLVSTRIWLRANKSTP
jgi:hypothetical protein